MLSFRIKFNISVKVQEAIILHSTMNPQLNIIEKGLHPSFYINQMFPNYLSQPDIF